MKKKKKKLLVVIEIIVIGVIFVWVVRSFVVVIWLFFKDLDWEILVSLKGGFWIFVKKGNRYFLSGRLYICLRLKVN